MNDKLGNDGRFARRIFYTEDIKGLKSNLKPPSEYYEYIEASNDVDKFLSYALKKGFNGSKIDDWFVEKASKKFLAGYFATLNVDRKEIFESLGKDAYVVGYQYNETDKAFEIILQYKADFIWSPTRNYVFKGLSYNELLYNILFLLDHNKIIVPMSDNDLNKIPLILLKLLEIRASYGTPLERKYSEKESYRFEFIWFLQQHIEEAWTKRKELGLIDEISIFFGEGCYLCNYWFITTTATQVYLFGDKKIAFIFPLCKNCNNEIISENKNILTILVSKLKAAGILSHSDFTANFKRIEHIKLLEQIIEMAKKRTFVKEHQIKNDSRVDFILDANYSLICDLKSFPNYYFGLYLNEKRILEWDNKDHHDHAVPDHFHSNMRVRSDNEPSYFMGIPHIDFDKVLDKVESFIKIQTSAQNANITNDNL